MNKDDPLNPNGRYRHLLRANSAGVDGRLIGERSMTADALKMLCKGAGHPEIYNACWKRADGYNRPYLKFGDLNAVADVPIRLNLLTGKVADTGVSKYAGVYLGGFPAKLVAAYEEWYAHASSAYPDTIAGLVFRLPYMKAGMAVMREGVFAAEDYRTSRLIYQTEETQYTIQSCFDLGKDSADLW